MKASSRIKANVMSQPTSDTPTWCRHGRTTPFDDHLDLTVLKRIRRWFLPANFKPDEVLLQQLTTGYDQGDVLADQLVAQGQLFAKPLIACLGESKQTVPDAYAALAADYLARPAWFDVELARAGAAAYRRYPLLLIWLLRNVALMTGYSIPALSLPLLQTGALVHDALPRLMRTYAYILSVAADDVLSVGGEGWRQSLMVRQIHAQVRQGLLQPKADRLAWDVAHWGLPVNQTDMVATHLQFSLLIMRGYRIFGARLSQEERAGIIHLWRLASYWLGVSLDRIPETETESWAWLYTYVATQRLDYEIGRPLAQALHDLPTQLMGEDNRIAQMVELTNASVTRVIVGDDVGDGLGLPRARGRSAVLLTSPLLFGLETLGERVPLVRQGLDRFAAHRQTKINWWFKENMPEFYQQVTPGAA